MAVIWNHYANRLLAYLHCKQISSTTRKYVEAELERIVGSLHALIEVDNKAHDPVPMSREDALLAVVGTYTMLSQFVRLTDLEPVTDQSVCRSAATEAAASEAAVPGT